jgi:hypothetical protein
MEGASFGSNLLQQIRLQQTMAMNGSHQMIVLV